MTKRMKGQIVLKTKIQQIQMAMITLKAAGDRLLDAITTTQRSNKDLESCWIDKTFLDK